MEREELLYALNEAIEERQLDTSDQDVTIVETAINILNEDAETLASYSNDEQLTILEAAVEVLTEVTVKANHPERERYIKKFLLNKYQYRPSTKLGIDGTITVDGKDYNVTFNDLLPTGYYAGKLATIFGDTAGEAEAINFGPDFNGKDNDLQYILQHEIGHHTLGHRKMILTKDGDELTFQQYITKAIMNSKGSVPKLEEMIVGENNQKLLKYYNSLKNTLTSAKTAAVLAVGGKPAKMLLDKICDQSGMTNPQLDLLKSMLARPKIVKPTDEIDKAREENYKKWNAGSLASSNNHAIAYEAEADAYAIAHIDPRAYNHPNANHVLGSLAKMYGFKLHKDGTIEIPKNLSKKDSAALAFNLSRFPDLKPITTTITKVYKVSAAQDLQYRADAYDKIKDTEAGKIYEKINPRKIERVKKLTPEEEEAEEKRAKKNREAVEIASKALKHKADKDLETESLIRGSSEGLAKSYDRINDLLEDYPIIVKKNRR